MADPIYGPGVTTPHFISALIASTSRQNGGMAPLSAWAPNGVRSIIPAGLGRSRSESFYAPDGQPGRKLAHGDTFTWAGTFVADLGPARRDPAAWAILWQLHAGSETVDIPARLSCGTNGIGIGGRNYATGGAGTGWWTQLVDGARGDVVEHHLSVTMALADDPATGHVHVEFDGQTVKDDALQTWPTPDMGITDMAIRAGIYRGTDNAPAPRAQSCTWRDVSYTITSP